MTTNQPEQAAGSDRPRPVTVGRYELVSPRTAGALGELWKGRIASGPEIGRFVAVRRLLRTPETDAAAVDRVAKGGFTAMELRHPRVTALLDVAVADTEIAAISEYIGGTFLQALFRPPTGKRPSVPVPVVTRIALDLLEALEGAHSAWAELFPVVETDEEQLLAAGVYGGLMPDTILIASFGETLLHEAGFSGVALTIPRFSGHPDALAYRAPEQLAATQAEASCDVRSDVFTVGIIVWELVSGRALFGPALLPRPATVPSAKAKQAAEALQASSTRHKVLTAAIARLDTLPLLRGKVSKELADCVAKCLERDPSARFQSTSEALIAFRSLGPNAIAPHTAVASFMASTVAPEVPEEGPDSGAVESNRPTEPPERERDTPPPETRRGPTADHTVAEVAGPTSVESSPSAAPKPIESTTAIVVSAEETEPTPTVPASEPSPLEASPVPSLSLLEAADAVSHVEPLPESSRVVADVAEGVVELDSVPPESLDVEPLPASNAAPLPVQPEHRALIASPSPFGHRHEASSAPVVRPVHDVELDVAASGSDLLRVERRARNQKLVVRVVAVAGALSLVAVLRAWLGKSEDVTPATAPAASAITTHPISESPPATATEAPAPRPTALPVSPAVPPPHPVQSAAPTSSLSTTPPVAAGASSVAQKPKKKPFRPTGI